MRKRITEAAVVCLMAAVLCGYSDTCVGKEAGKTAQAGMVVLDHKTGYVLGVIGGLGEKTTSMGLNRGTQAVKQTGSSMKPLAVVAPGIVVP